MFDNVLAYEGMLGVDFVVIGCFIFAVLWFI